MNLEFRGSPWAILPEVYESLCQTLVSVPQGVEGQSKRLPAVSGAIGVLPIRGVITHRDGDGLLALLFGGTNTEAIGRAFDDLIGNPSVGAVVLDIDSPGGVVYGVPELAAKIRSARGRKPIIASVNSTAASAAYWIATAADQIAVTPSGQVGSIGVFAEHYDFSGMLDKAGIRPTLVSAGRYKVEGNPYEPLGSVAREETQRRVDAYYEMFVADVAAGRGVSANTVRNGFGEGRTVGAAEAVSLRMADMLATPDEVFGRLRRSVGGKGRAAALRANELEIAAALLDGAP
jgi:signal peptide peptidase SppA